MFKTPFYTVQKIDSLGNLHTITIKLNIEHPIYKGHFPQQPVVPGVCTLQIIKECVSDITKKDIRYSTIPSCKFTSLIVPSEELIELTIDLDANYSCNASVNILGQSVLKLKANFIEK